MPKSKSFCFFSQWTRETFYHSIAYDIKELLCRRLNFFDAILKLFTILHLSTFGNAVTCIVIYPVKMLERNGPDDWFWRSVTCLQGTYLWLRAKLRYIQCLRTYALDIPQFCTKPSVKPRVGSSNEQRLCWGLYASATKLYRVIGEPLLYWASSCSW